jgi:hypothetical protein
MGFLMTEYGKHNKSIVFSDTDKRHAELRLKLRRDGISQIDFFTSMITGYINNDPNILMYITKVKQAKGKIGKKKIAKQNKDIQQGNQALQDLGLTERDVDFIFDLIERGDDEF